MAPGARLVCRAVSTEDRANRARCDTHAAHRTGASAGTGNHLSQSSRCVSPPPGSESPENGSPRFGRTRVEAPARGYQGILRSIDNRERGLQLVCGRTEENRFLAIHILEAEIRSEKIAIGDFPFLQKLLYGELRGCRIGRGLLGLLLKLHDKPVWLREPLNSGFKDDVSAREIQFHFLLTHLDLCEDVLRIAPQQVAEEIDTIQLQEPLFVERLPRLYRGEY